MITMNMQNRYLAIPEHLRNYRGKDSGKRRRATDKPYSTEYTSRQEDDGRRPAQDHGRVRATAVEPQRRHE